jgi:hypothetical protein
MGGFSVTDTCRVYQEGQVGNYKINIFHAGGEIVKHYSKM